MRPGHDGGRTPEEGERGAGHPGVADRDQLGDPRGSLVAEHADRPDEPGLEHATGEGGHADGHGHRSYVGWLLLAPLLAFTLIAPQPLGAFSAERAAAPPPPPASQSYDALPAGDPVDLTLRDFTSRSLWGGGKTLEGRSVALVGFVTPRPAGGYFVTRLVIACSSARRCGWPPSP